MTAGPAPSLDSEITWLLHRAAQRMHVVTGEQAEKHGLQLRDYIVLSALDKTPGLTQVELARALGLDKTTLMTQLDRLEQEDLVVRHADPNDRRRRIPAITAVGDDVRARVARASEEAERSAMADFSQAEVDMFRRMLFTIIGTTVDPGSCL
ncbi:MarR family winged helix-turn-helix transcriptional regulator [Micromonospora vinacea]|uniref:DNA-binding MarR family transcriptional regulator n=1 Tax=Micromonospora vinacea TaxID=709878 RepID=A0ABS0K387_9ACTN|nr:MarR family winged helix-turn-helix transcriptional regulator [Micromonospora vinacea]MBG6103049.1 DNA-binding MarR family transcriptional regulator [Micromonospora vinacea]WSZ74203.1 MarR family winged helix-turn-helix transcriptional regulator [Micromonospora sp. NBC_00860]WTA69319.1 MarR family winged helix-turn-helix transcriptional regulator [Micromonospora sp. NBC_00855]